MGNRSNSSVGDVAPVEDVMATIHTEPADERGEQWHGVHSKQGDLREPRRDPGGVQRTVAPDCGGDHRC